MKTRTLNFNHIDTSFKQDYLNIQHTSAISAEGVIFKIGDVVGHSGSENKDDRGTISKFIIDEKTVDVIAHTERGYGRISFMYHPD